MLGLWLVRRLRRARLHIIGLMLFISLVPILVFFSGHQQIFTISMQIHADNENNRQPITPLPGAKIVSNKTVDTPDHARNEKRHNSSQVVSGLAPPVEQPKNFSRRGFHTLYSDPSSPPAVLQSWLMSKSSQCGEKFVAYGNEVAMATDIILDNSKITGQIGGGNFYDLMNQKEDVEFFKYRNGFMEMKCPSLPKYKFNNKNHLNSWLVAMSVGDAAQYDALYNGTYLAITRYEYVNLYHTMTDFYNAFLVMAFFNLTQHETNILIIDGHPWGSLDPVWETLFNSTVRLGHLPARSKFTNLIFGQQGYNSYIFKGDNKPTSGNIPLMNAFRKFFLTSYDLETERKLNCSALSFLIIFRRPYMAHPRNPSGDVHRKIKNEDEIINAIKEKHPSSKMVAVQLDSWNMQEQAKFASEADVMIGMHGAGLSLLTLLPQHGAVIELMPNYIKPAWKKHFINMAKWRHLIYKRWYNNDKSLEFPDHYTRVPPEVILTLIEEAKQEMCKGHT